MLPLKQGLAVCSAAAEATTPDGWEVFHERDMRELGVGLGNVIAMAEQLIVNDNSAEEAKGSS